MLTQGEFSAGCDGSGYMGGCGGARQGARGKAAGLGRGAHEMGSEQTLRSFRGNTLQRLRSSSPLRSTVRSHSQRLILGVPAPVAALSADDIVALIFGAD